MLHQWARHWTTLAKPTDVRLQYTDLAITSFIHSTGAHSVVCVCMCPLTSLDLRVVVVGGVSGCGKSTAGRLLATQIQAKFYEGDDFHSPGNIGTRMFALVW